MRHIVRHSSKRWVATLCVALMVMFAGASASRIVNELQHVAGHPPGHDMLGAVTLDQHAAEHHEIPSDDGGPVDHLVGGHHHHADAGWSLVASAPADAMIIAVTEGGHGSVTQRRPTGLILQGPERPPKAFTHDV